MKQGFFYRLRQDTDRIWKSGMGLMLILLFLVRPAAHVSNRCKSGIRPVVGRI